MRFEWRARSSLVGKVGSSRFAEECVPKKGGGTLLLCGVPPEPHTRPKAPWRGTRYRVGRGLRVRGVQKGLRAQKIL